MTIEKLITVHMDIWSSALQTRSTAGRGSNGKIDLYGIKKLRELILELAVRGKLVPQDPNDEPTSELLKQIEKERDELVKSKVIRKPKTLEKITRTKMPFNLPDGWEWCYLNDIGDWGAGATPSRSNSKYYNGDIPWFKSGELSSDFISDSEEKVTELALQECSLRYNKVGDILIAMYGATIGKTSILNVCGTTNQAVCACTPYSEISNVYLLTLLKAYKRIFIDMGAGGAQPNISREKLIATVIALPPNAEQNRIVYKVKELMSLCDQLEQQSLTSLDAHHQLVETLLETLTDSQNVEELAENWARISQHFDTLFTTEASIDALKQTILQLAVMGKLVPQDPNNEPASELLKRIEQEKAQMVKDGKIKKQKPLPPISDEEKPFELPQGWEWSRLGDLAHNSEAGWSPQCEASPRVDDNWGVLKISSVTWNEFNPNENKALPKHLEPKIEYEVKAKDFLISRANTADLVARSVVVPDSLPSHLMLSDKIIRFQFSELIDANYINLVNNSKYSRTYYSEVAGGTSSSMKNVSRIQVSSLLVALPSYNEQLNIVEKVHDLTLLCEHLKSRLQSVQQTQLHLADALTEAALN